MNPYMYKNYDKIFIYIIIYSMYLNRIIYIYFKKAKFRCHNNRKQTQHTNFLCDIYIITIIYIILYILYVCIYQSDASISHQTMMLPYQKLILVL